MTDVTVTRRDAEREVERDIALVDADVHPIIMPGALAGRLSTNAREHLARFGLRVANGMASFPRMRNGGVRDDAWAAEGEVAGSDLDLVRRQHLDAYGIDRAVLTPLQPSVFGGEAPEIAAELCRAVDDWMRDEWLAADPRLLGSICPPHEHPDLAVAEIERLAGDPRFVQVLLPTTAEQPWGNRKYWPIFRAATEAGLPVALHTGGVELHRGAGWPSYYMEMHVAIPNTMATQMLSLVCSGVFDAIPDLQIVSIECGIAWAAALVWMLDDSWQVFREGLPSSLREAPSELIRRHFWFTTQPIDEPDDPDHLAFAFDALGMTDRIMFSTDYPHWDFDSPDQTLPRSLSKEVKRMIFAENACRLYDLPR
jgi:predicted TIM-barrel fold metal-dependent hydrolase